MYSKVIFLDISLQVITRYWISCYTVNPYCLSAFCIVVLSVNSIFLICPPLPSLSPLITVCLFSMAVSLFLVCIWIHLYYFLHPTHVTSYSNSLPAWLRYTSRPMPAAVNGNVSLFWLSYIPLCVCAPHLLSQSCTDGHLVAALSCYCKWRCCEH